MKLWMWIIIFLAAFIIYAFFGLLWFEECVREGTPPLVCLLDKGA